MEGYCGGGETTLKALSFRICLLWWVVQIWIGLFCVTLQFGSVLFTWYYSGSGCSLEQSDLGLYLAGSFIMIFAAAFWCPDILKTICNNYMNLSSQQDTALLDKWILKYSRWIGHVPSHSVLMNTTKDTELLVKWNSNTLGQDQHSIPIINNGWVT